MHKSLIVKNQCILSFIICIQKDFEGNFNELDLPTNCQVGKVESLHNTVIKMD